MSRKTLAVVMMLVLTLGMVVPGAVAQEPPPPEWPVQYDYGTLLTYHLKLTAENYEIIRYDVAAEQELPALFWATGDEYGYPADDQILVSVRRKSDAYPDEIDPQKLSFKIDINEYYDDGTGACDDGDYGFPGATCLDEWHDLKKLDLENGKGSDVVVEGFAWYLHQLAGESDVVDYFASEMSWVKLYITLIDAEGNEAEPFYAGLYVNVQQRDKQFLKNHGRWEGTDNTWLYKQEVSEVEYEEAPEDENGVPLDSPAFQALYFEPFQDCGHVDCVEQPTGQAFVDALNAWINMEGMLTFGAVSAFHTSPDGLFAAGQNAIFLDYGGTVDPHAMKREYIAWDLDTVFVGKDVGSSIYEQGKRDDRDYYQDLILNTPGNTTQFREQFTDIMRDLLYDPFQLANLLDATYQFEALLGDAIAADPYAIGGQNVGEYFSSFRDWIAARHANVLTQVGAPPLPVPQVTITSPEEGSTVSSSVTVTAEASDPDGTGVAQVEFLVEGASIGVDANGDDGWSATWDTTSTPDGLRTVSAVATNTAGQTATDSIQVTVDNLDTPPAVAITYPLDGSTVSGSVTITADASDDGRVTQVEFFADNVSIGIDTDGDDGWSAPWDTTGLENGSTHTIAATATDDAGQTATQSIQVSVDNSPVATMHIGDLDASVSVAKNGKWSVVVTIAVHDSECGPLAGALVTGLWSGATDRGGACTTDEAGLCDVTVTNLHQKTDTVTWTVTAVDLAGHVYQPGDNHDPDGDSNGTTITVTK